MQILKNQITKTLNRLKQENIKIFDLTASNPTQGRFKYPPEILTEFNNPFNLQYKADAQGLLLARQAVSDYYKKKGFDVSPQRIFLTSSTSEGYLYIFRLLMDVDDKVLFPQPSYPLFSFLTDINDVEMHTYPLNYIDGKWQVNQEEFRQAFTAKVKAVTVVNPNNPTSSFIKKEESDFLNNMCRANNAAIICDEVFWDFTFDESKDYVSLVNNKNVLTFTLGGLSKTLGLPQMKLSWIVLSGPESEVEQAAAKLEVIADTFLSVNTPVQQALPKWLSLQEDIQKEIKIRLNKNKRFIEGIIAGDEHYQLLSIEGGWYAILKILDNQNEEDLVLNLLKNYSVSVHPGYFFDFEEGQHLIISLLTEESIFQEGLRRILNCYENI